MCRLEPGATDSDKSLQGKGQGRRFTLMQWVNLLTDVPAGSGRWREEICQKITFQVTIFVPNYPCPSPRHVRFLSE